MPRTKSDHERGYIGAWLRMERMGRGSQWTPEFVVEALRSRTGTQIRVDYYRQLEAGTGGKVPGPDLLEDFVTLYGSRPQPLPEPEATAAGLSPDTVAIVAAIDRLTAVLAAQQGEAPVWAQAVVSAVLAGRQLQPADATREGR